MVCSRLLRLAASVTFSLKLAPIFVSADEVTLLGKPPFRKVEVLGFRDARVVFRGLSGQVLRKPLRDVQWIELDRAPQFTAAERAAGDGLWPAALAGYEQVAGDASAPDWLRDLARLRHVQGLQHSGRFPDAVEGLIAICRERPSLANEVVLREPASPGGGANREAIGRLKEAAGELPPAQRDRLERLRLELLIYEAAAKLPRELAERAAEPLPGDLVEAAPPSQKPPEAGDEPPLVRPVEPAGNQRASGAAVLELPPDSFVLRAAEAAARKGAHERVVELLERAVPFAPEAEREHWRVELGKSLVAAGRVAEAASALQTAAERLPAGPIRAESLYYWGVSLERLGRPAEAREVFELALRDAAAGSELRERIRAGLRRIGD